VSPRPSTLRAVPQTAPRALALIRVSKEREGMVSPELQDTAIGDHCARSGYTITHRMEGLDESGSRSRSRWWAKLDTAVGMVEAGDIDVIVVWKFSRTARHRLRWAVALDRVEAAGGRLESATEQVDVSTSTGRFTRGMLAELAAFEADRIGETWKETHHRRRSLGLPHGGGYRPGYRYEDKTYRPDPDTAPLVAEAYDRYLAGAGLRALADWLTAVGVTSRSGGGAWTHRGVGSLLETGWAAGLLHVHDPACRCGDAANCARRVWIPGAHEPIITGRVWKAYRSERDRRAGTPRRLLAPTSTLAGLVRCGACGYGMRMKQGRGVGGYYCCEHAGCPRPTSVVRARAEAAALEWLRVYASDVDRSAGLAASQRAARVTAKATVTRLARAVAQLDGELARLTREYTRGVIPEGAYAATRDELLAERSTAQVALDQAARAASPAGPPRKVAADLLARWRSIDVADRNRICRELLRVVVSRGPWRSEVVVVPAWEWAPPTS
jgi:site-specific DNA recombinase